MGDVPRDCVGLLRNALPHAGMFAKLRARLGYTAKAIIKKDQVGISLSLKYDLSGTNCPFLSREYGLRELDGGWITSCDRY